MEVTQRLDELEGELKIIKNEVQSVLLDVREHVLSFSKNPFQMINFRPPSPKEEFGEEDERKPAGRPEGSGGGGGGSSSPHSGDMVVQDGGDGMPNQESNNQLKALMDQLERERQSLREEKQDLAQQAAAAAASPPPSAPVSPPGVPGGQFNPGFQPPPQQYQPPMQQYPPPYPAQGGFGHPMNQLPGQPGAGFGVPGQSPTAGSKPAGARPGQTSLRSEREDPYRDRAGAPEPNTRRRRFSGEITDVEEERRKSSARRTYGSARYQEAKEPDEDRGLDGEQVNLLTLVGLVRWVEKSIKKIGKEKLEAIVELYQTAGYLPMAQKEVIAQILKLADGEKPEGPVTMGISIQVLLELDSLLGGKFQTESSILSTLFTEDGGYPWTKQ